MVPSSSPSYYWCCCSVVVVVVVVEPMCWLLVPPMIPLDCLAPSATNLLYYSESNSCAVVPLFVVNTPSSLPFVDGRSADSNS